MDTDGKDVVFEQRIFIGAGDAGAQDGHHGYEHHPGLPIAEGEIESGLRAIEIRRPDFQAL